MEGYKEYEGILLQKKDNWLENVDESLILGVNRR